MDISNLLKYFIRPLLTLLALAILSLPACLQANDEFDINNLIGQWQGGGQVTIPGTSMSMEIEGTLSVIADSIANRYRTTLASKTLLVPYSDSGVIAYRPKDSRLTWEIWNNWGHHRTVSAQIDGDRVTAAVRISKLSYEVVIRFAHSDTLLFQMFEKDVDSTKIESARLTLLRQK